MFDKNGHQLASKDFETAPGIQKFMNLMGRVINQTLDRRFLKSGSGRCALLVTGQWKLEEWRKNLKSLCCCPGELESREQPRCALLA